MCVPVHHNAKYGNSTLVTELPELAICVMNPYECFLEVYKELEFSFMSFSANCGKSAIAAKSCQLWQFLCITRNGNVKGIPISGNS